MKTNAYEKHNENVENLLCIGVDGRTDKDTTLQGISGGKWK